MLEEIVSNTRIYKFGISDIQLTLLCEEIETARSNLVPVSLRSKSFITSSKKYSSSECSFVKKNPNIKYYVMIYPTKVDLKYFTQYHDLLNDIIDFSNIKPVHISEVNEQKL